MSHKTNIAAFAMALGTLVPIGLAQAAQTCSSGIKHSSITGDVTVEGTCTIQGSRIDGNVTIRPGSTLIIKDSSILGQVTGDKVKALETKSSNLGKGIAITGGVDSVKLTHSTISGAPVVLSGAKAVDVVSSNISSPMRLKDNSGVLNVNFSNIDSGLTCNRGVKYNATSSNVSGAVDC